MRSSLPSPAPTAAPTAAKMPAHSTPIFLTWLPLAVMWILMAVEQPAVTAVVARMDNAVLQLAAFGITFSIALFIEGPIVQMLAAGTAIADSRANYTQIIRVMLILGWSATAVQALLCVPAVFEVFARSVMRMPESLILPSRQALVAMLPWTISIGYRRLWQGLLIGHGRSRVIPLTMTARILATFIVLFWGMRTRLLPGAALGGAALSVGVIAGALASGLFAVKVIRTMPENSPEENMSLKAMFVFYIPLALVNFLTLGIRPVMQIGLARGIEPVDSLAVWPVILGYLFLYTSLSISSQEVVIARLRDADSCRALVRFNCVLAAVMTGLYLLVCVSPLWEFWFSRVAGLEYHLTLLTRPALLLSLPAIPLAALLSLFRGALVARKRTKEVTWGIAVNVSTLLVVLFGGVKLFHVPAVNIVAAAFGLGYLADFLFLLSRKPLASYLQD